MKTWKAILFFGILISIGFAGNSYAQYIGDDNSPDVSHERIGVGLTRDITWPPPIKQIKSFDFEPENVKCNSGLELIFKINGSPACVKPETALELMLRSWAKNDTWNSKISGKSIVIIPMGSSIPEKQIHLIPKEITVVLGHNNTVTWLNQGDTPSTLVSDQMGWSTGLIEPRKSASITFNQTGVYNYHGEPSPWVTGTILVLPENYDIDNLPSSGKYDFERLHMTNACSKEPSFCFGVLKNGTQIMIQCDFPIHGCSPILFGNYTEVENEN